jgi:hypothetical protein
MDLCVQNEEALSEFRSNPDNFYEKVQQCVDQSKVKIFEKVPATNLDKHYLIFDQFEQDVHGVVLKNMKYSALAAKNENYSKESGTN